MHYFKGKSEYFVWTWHPCTPYGDCLLVIMMFLTDVIRMWRLISVGGVFVVTDIKTLSDVPGVSRLPPWEGTLFITNKSVLADVSGILNLTNMNEKLRLQHLGDISAFGEFSYLTSAERALNTFQNGKLPGIHGLAYLTHVGGSLFKVDNGLHAICRFANVIFMIGDLTVCFNHSLINTSGFGNLCWIGRSWVISPGNALLYRWSSQNSLFGWWLGHWFQREVINDHGFLNLGSVWTSETIGHQHL